MVYNEAGSFAIRETRQRAPNCSPVQFVREFTAAPAPSVWSRGNALYISLRTLSGCVLFLNTKPLLFGSPGLICLLPLTRAPISSRHPRFCPRRGSLPGLPNQKEGCYSPLLISPFHALSFAFSVPFHLAGHGSISLHLIWDEALSDLGLFKN